VKRMLFVPGFSADTYHSIQKRYVALAYALRGCIDMVWCLPPDDPAEWVWADPARWGESSELLSAVRGGDFEIVRLPIHSHSPLYRIRRFQRLLATGRFDGVYTLFTNRFAPLYAAKSAGVTTIWDSAWNSLARPHRHRFIKKLFYRRYIDYFAAATPIIAANLIANGIAEDRVFVRWSALDLTKVPEVDEARARVRIREELSLPREAELVLQFTSFLPSKNVHMAIRALGQLAATHADVRWIFAGERGPQTRSARELAVELGVAELAVFTGHRHDTWDLLAAADIIALTSRQDGLPNSLLEGMAARRPVVATYADGPECIVRDGENGFLVPCDDHVMFAKRVGELLHNPALRARMGAEGRERVERDFAMEPWCRRMRGFLVGCLDHSTRGGAARDEAR
jgi:glycosyltransferase involved in cell wall biosynthesis